MYEFLTPMYSLVFCNYQVYAEDFLAKSLNSQPESVSKKLEADRLEAQELYHKVK